MADDAFKLPSHLERLRAIASEHCDDYLIVTRVKKSEDGATMAWTYSDTNWATGVMERILREIDTRERCAIQNEEEGR